MVSLIIESPLAKSYIGSTVLHHLNHVDKVFLLLLVEFSVVVSAGDVDVVLGLGLGWLKGAS